MLKSICPRYCPSPFCLTVCPAHAIVVGDGDRNIYLDLDRCNGCGICHVACTTWSRDKTLERKLAWVRAGLAKES